MASIDPGFVDEDAARYIWDHADEPEVLGRLREECEEQGLPVTGPDTGALLMSLAASATASTERVPRVVEVGCLFGYSARWMLRGIPEEGVVETIEHDPDHADRAEEGFRRAGVQHRTQVLRGPALEILPTLEPPVDMVFLDAAKQEYPDYLDHALRLARPGTIITADNVLWHGHVWDDEDDDATTLGIRAFNRRIREDPMLASVLLPVGDGLSVSVVKG